ncbi:MAG TPA: hypothetical protein VEW66_04180 [Thermomicrobiales bacterium]|nr:hypothetical protein [Thermomicrobiales bacterium]
MLLVAPARRVSFMALALASILALLTSSFVLAQESTPAAGDSEIATQLPPADLPSMNEQGFLFELDSSWEGSFDTVPTEAPVYRMVMPTYDADSFGAYASNLGIEGEVQDLGSGSWEVTSDQGSLYAAPGFAQYISGAEVPEGELPTDDQALAYAREWLRQTGTLPADAGPGMVVERVEDPPRVFVAIKPVQPENLMAAYPNITIILGPNAQVLEASYRWYDLQVADTYALLPATTAWQEVSERRAFLQTSIPAEFAEPGSTIRGRATYTSVIVSYTTSGVVGEEQYLQPVYIFQGTVQLEGSEETIAISAFVPALINSQQPVG